MNLKISVVTVTLNQGATIAQSLQSVFDQTYSNFEVIVADGGSSDETLSVLQKINDPRLRWFSQQDNGTSQAMNRACKIATGDIFIFLNSDDYLASPYTFSEVISDFMSLESPDMICGNIEMIDNKSGIFIKKINSQLGSQCRWITIQFSGLFVKRWLWETKPFDESFKIANDHEAICFWTHCLKAKTLYRNKTHVIFRLGGISNSIPKAQLVAHERRRIRKSYDNYLSAEMLFLFTSTINILRRLHFRPFYWIRSFKIKLKQTPYWHAHGR